MSHFNTNRVGKWQAKSGYERDLSNTKLQEIRGLARWRSGEEDAAVKNLPTNAGDARDMDSIPGSERYPEVRNGNPLQYYSLDRGAWRTIVRGVAKSRTQPSTHVHSKLRYSRPFKWRRRWHPTPVLLPGESHGWRSLVGCIPWGC